MQKGKPIMVHVIQIMLMFFLFTCLLQKSSWALNWYPNHFNPILSEQLDLMTANNATLVSDWMKNISQNDDETPFGTFESVDSIEESRRTFNRDRDRDPDRDRDRDREPLDDVERIIPRQWPGKADILPTRSTVPSSTEIVLTRRSSIPATLAQRKPPIQRYPPIFIAPPPTVAVDEVFCDFGPLPEQSLCEWQNGNGALEWIPGTGLGTNWLGGPSVDSTAGTMEGGYAFVETSQLPLKDVKSKSSGALMHSPQLGSTGASGICIMFKYSMDGLSTAGLRVLLHAGVDEYSIKKEPVETVRLENITSICHPVEITEERVLWQAQYYILGMWQQAQILYTYPHLHSLLIEGIPVDSSDPSRLYRGYIAVDDIDLQPGSSCIGFCNFASGFCDWSNDAEDDFDWTISRGSVNPTTGPSMDSSNDRVTGGGYAYIDSSFPRKPGDTARLISTSFPATGSDAPMCMRFWFHMFGSGIGNLKIFLRHFRSLDAVLQEIWGLNGNVGNAWFMSQVTIGSVDDFQLIFEASVGNIGMGDIAIDDISFVQGVCPVFPQVAATNPRDCTFEIDECDWINSRDPDRVEWERVSTEALSPRNQRKPYSNGYTLARRNEYFLALGRSRGGPRSSGGGTAQLVSREMRGSDDPLCITFWYIMFEPFIDSMGPSLGVLRVFIQPDGETSKMPRPIWQLYNNQGSTWNYAQANINEKRNFNVVFEGTWGPNRANGNIGIDDIAFYTGNCTVIPQSASVRGEDCSFEKGVCGWENVTSSDNDRSVTWQRAFLTHRPAQLLDKTFGATGDFVFFDIFTTDKKSTEVQLRSPIINVSFDESSVCFTFWFAAFGVEESTALQIIKISIDDDANNGSDENNNKEELLWSLTAKGFNNPRPLWTPAQVTIDAQTSYRLILKGSASNGGFAIDDIRFQPQACAVRPIEAQPVVNRI